MFREEHGGSCCGITHIFDFHRYSEVRERELLRGMENGRDAIAEDNDEFFDEDGNRNNKKVHHLFEVALTDQQLIDDDSAWACALKRLGFKHVARFMNSNSGNYCNLLVHYPRAREKKPFKW